MSVDVTAGVGACHGGLRGFLGLLCVALLRFRERVHDVRKGVLVCTPPCGAADASPEWASGVPSPETRGERVDMRVRGCGRTALYVYR